MSSCQRSPAEVLLPAESVIASTAGPPADLEEASRLTLAALEVSGQQQQAAGLGFIGDTCVLLMCPCVKIKALKNAHA